MVYTPLINKVLKFIYKAHDGAADRSGVPYVFHPFSVAQSLERENEVLLALLHDVVEDTDYTFDDIRALGVPEEVVEALKLLTHDKNVPYLDYVREVKKNPLARAVKLADLRHNSDLSRLEVVTEKDFARREKYQKAQEILLS